MVSKNRQALEDTLATVRGAGGRHEPLTATEVAEAGGWSVAVARERLRHLAERGDVASKAVGADERVWWATGDAETPGDGASLPTSRPVTDAADAGQVGVVVLDDDGQIAWINGWIERYLGVDRAAVVGRDRRQAVRERMSERVANPDQFVRTVLSSDDESGDRESEFRVAVDGDLRWLRHDSQPVESGQFAGGRVEFYYDVTGEKAGERKQVEQEQLFRSLVQATEEYAIFMLDADGTVVTWNPGAERIKGYAAEEIIGEHFSTFYTDDAADAGVPAENLAQARERGSVEDEGWRVRQDGTQFWANVTITAIRDDEGALRGFAKVTRDMTDRREWERQLEQERNLLARIFDATPVSLAVVGADGTIDRANERALDRLGAAGADREEYHLGDLDLYDERGEFVSVDERPVTRALETGEPVRDWQGQVDLADLGRRWVTITAVPLTVEGEAREQVVVCVDDVTQIKQQAERLEAQRDDLESELDEVFERVSNAFFGVDDDWRFTYVNEQAETLLGRDAGTLPGTTIWDQFETFVGSTFEAKFREAIETQQPVHFEEYHPPQETWFDVDVYPSESGLSVYFRDVTGRKARERELERYETLFKGSKDVNAVIDADGTFSYVTPSAAHVLGYQPDALTGENAFEYVHPDDREEVRARFDAVVEDADPGPPVEFRLRRADGSWAVLESEARNLLDDPMIDGVVVYTRDVTGRKARERELERYETIVSTMDDGVYVVDDDGWFTMVNESYAEMLGYDREELVGEHVSKVVDDKTIERAKDIHRELAASRSDTGRLEATLRRADGEEFAAEATFAMVEGDDGDRYRLGVVRDVSARVAYERRLETKARQQEVVADLGQRALAAPAIDDLFDQAVELVADTLDNEYCKVLDLDEAAEELRFRSGVGWKEGYVGTATVGIDRASQAGYTLLADEPVVVDDMSEEDRFSGPDLLIDHAVESGISVVIGSPERPWGVLGTHDTEPRSFTDDDALFVQSVANILATAIDRHEREAELESRREHLAALNNLNAVVRDVNEAIVDQSTRAEIEQTVCDRLADSDSYRFAWVGDVDPRSESVEPRAAAGTEGYLDEISLSVDGDDPTGQGPTGRAVRTKEIQVIHDALSDPEYEPWREYAREYGFRSSAAIPIVHEDTLYGVLSVYADRVGAFADEEREVVAQLGELVGHAIAAVDRKQALMSDELVELEFRIENVLDVVGVPGTLDGRLEIDQTVPVGEGEFLVYGTASDEGLDMLEAITEQLPHWEEVVELDANGEESRFEAHLSDPPVLSMIAARGGSVESATIENGTYTMTVHLPPTVDVRTVIERVQETYPPAQMVTRKQVSAPEQRQQPDQSLTDPLTERQRAALEASFHAGFFEWPRESSGEEVAESLDVSAPTFHQHLRKAQQKIFETLLA